MANLEDYSIEEYPKTKDPFERFFEEAFKHAKAKSLEFVLGKENYETGLLLKALENHDYRQAIINLSHSEH
jgi:hypothetical protein